MKKTILAIIAISAVMFISCTSEKLTVAVREVKATIDYYEFANPDLGKQLAKVADSCFNKEDAPFLIFSILPMDTLYVELPDVDPELGAPYTAVLETYNNEYYDIECDSAIFASVTACTKIGERLCFISDSALGLFIKTNRQITERHFTSDDVCSCLEEERYFLLDDNGLVLRVYPYDVFIPDGPIDSVIVDLPDDEPQFNGSEESLSQWIAERIDWPDSIKSTLANFTVELDGSVTDVQAPPSVKEPDERAFIESLRPLLTKMPRWTPGKHHGKTVRSCSTTRLRRPE